MVVSSLISELETQTKTKNTNSEDFFTRRPLPDKELEFLSYQKMRQNKTQKLSFASWRSTLDFKSHWSNSVTMQTPHLEENAFQILHPFRSIE